MVKFKTERLVLRDFTQPDLVDYEGLRSYSEFQKYYPDEDAEPEKAAELLKMFINQAVENPRTKFQFSLV